MAVQIPDFSTLGVVNPQPGGALPVYPQTSPGAEGEAALGQGIAKAGGTLQDIDTYSQIAKSRLERSMATVDLFNRLVPLHSAIAKETDPERVAQLQSQYSSALQTSGNAIGDPAARQAWMATHAKTIADFNADADTRNTTLYRGKAIADIQTQADSAVRNAVASDDPMAVPNAQLAIDDLTDWGSKAGALTPEQAYTLKKGAQKQLVIGSARSLFNQGRPDEAVDLLRKNSDVVDPITLEQVMATGQAKSDSVVALRAVNQALGRSDTAGDGQVNNWETQNNNFGGIRKVGVPAAGPNAGGFQSFATPEDGVRAIDSQLQRYYQGATTGKPLTTLRQMVSTWAPPSENDTPALIARAAKVTGFGPDEQLTLDAPTRAKLIEATIRNEQGGKLPVDPSVIEKVTGAPLPQTAIPITRGQRTLEALPDYLNARAAVMGNTGLNDRQRKLALDGLNSQFHQETTLYNAFDANAKRDLADRQSANQADLLGRVIGGENVDPQQLADWVRTQQITPEAYRGIQAELTRQGRGQDDPDVFNDIDRRARNGEDVSKDIATALSTGQLKSTTALSLQRAADARNQRQGDQIEKANFSTLRTLAGGDAVEKGLISLGNADQARQVQLWAQAQQEWNQRVLIGKEDSNAVLADMSPRYGHPITDVGALPRPRLGPIAKPEDVGAVAQKTQEARDAGKITEQQFRQEQDLIVKYKAILDEQQKRTDAAAAAAKSAPSNAGRGRVEMKQ